MLPDLAPCFGGQGLRQEKVDAPRRAIVSAEGVRAAWPSVEGPFARTSASFKINETKKTPAQLAGLRYEKKAKKFLLSLIGASLQLGPWFRFEDASGRPRWCQPDALLVVEDVAVVFEIKIRLVPEAWTQCRALYEPVVRRAYQSRILGSVVVCKTIDPFVKMPAPIDNVNDLSKWILKRRFDNVGVFSWRP